MTEKREIEVYALKPSIVSAGRTPDGLEKVAIRWKRFRHSDFLLNGDY